MEPENASVTYFTLKDILDMSEEAGEVRNSKRAVWHSKKVSKILVKQKAEGYWEAHTEHYKPKYKATCWQVMSLGMLGLDRSHEQL